MHIKVQAHTVDIFTSAPMLSGGFYEAFLQPRHVSKLMGHLQGIFIVTKMVSHSCSHAACKLTYTATGTDREYD